MLFPELLRRNVVATGLAAGLLAGIAIGLLWPLPPVQGQAGGEMSLAMPSRAALDRYSEADFAKLRDGSLWRGSATAQGPAATMASWRLLGVVLRPEGAALVQADNRQLRVVVGGQFPDGAQLVAVTADSVEFRQGECHYRRTLYTMADEQIPSDGCPSAPGNDAATQAAGN